MARTKTVEELQAEQERIENELKIKTQKLKALKQQQQEQLRKERTHRLCTHGAMLEQYLPPDEYNDKQIDEFFRTMFQIPEVLRILQQIKEQTDEQPETG
jgi:hexokinase